MSLTLYKIQIDYQDLMKDLDDAINNPDITPEEMDALNDRLKINKEEFLQKADAYAAVIREKEARASFLSEESKRLALMAKQELSIADRLHERISEAMIQQGESKVTLSHYKLGFRKSESVEITDQELIPEYLMRIKPAPAPEPDKVAIKAALKAGPVPGAVLIEKQNLQIK